jgi:parallel beta-helix repeat protein
MNNNRKSHIKTLQRGFFLTGILAGLLLTAFSFPMDILNTEKLLPTKMEEGSQTPKINAYDSPISINFDIWLTHPEVTDGVGTPGDPFIIEDLVIDATGSTNGISITSCTAFYAIIRNCTIINGSYGIYFWNVMNCQLIDNKFYNNTVGMQLIDSPSTIVTGNVFTNQPGHGISITKCSNIIIDNNSIEGAGSDSIYIGDSHYCDVSNNNISEAHNAFNLNNVSHSTFTENIVVGSISDGINLKDSTDCTLSGNNLSYCQGFEIESSDFIFLSGNSITNSRYGIDLLDSSDCTLLENTISNSSFEGILLTNAPNSNLTGNYIRDCLDSGIVLDSSANSVLIENYALNNGIYESDSEQKYGIHLKNSPTSDLRGNNVTESYYTGIEIENSPDTNLTSNVVDKNGYYGIYLDSSSGCHLSENWVSASEELGVYLYYSSSCNLSRNNISENRAHGLFLVGSVNCDISENRATKNQGNGIYVSSNSDNNLVYENYLIKNDVNTIGNAGVDNDIHDNYYIGDLEVSFTADILVFFGELANFTASPTDGMPPFSYFWDFGDATTSLDQNPSHNYTSPGTYTVTATVTDDDGDTAQDSWTVSVIVDLEPVASFTVSTEIPNVDEVISFTDTSTGGNLPLSYHWDFGDTMTSTDQHPTHSYGIEGTFTVSLTVTDGDGDVNSSSMTITVSGYGELSASFTVSSDNVFTDEEVSFTDTTAGGSPPLSYSWDFGDGTSSTEQNPTHTYAEAGTYTVTLTVTDGDSESSSYDEVIEVNLSEGTGGSLFDDIPGFPIASLIILSGIAIYLLQKRHHDRIKIST